MSGGRRGLLRPNLPAFEKALDDAWQDANTPARGESPAPKPLCDGRWAEFADYVSPPSPKQAAALCGEGTSGECPLFALCRANARNLKPSHGVWAGEAWDMGRRVALQIKPAEKIVD